MKESENCPCGSNTYFSQCCHKYLSGHAKVKTAEQLMRSRYSAYVKENESYLKNTWHKNTQPDKINFEAHIKWSRLKIINTDQGSVEDEQGTVEFIATYKTNGRASRLHEISRFVRHQGDWVYLDGEIQEQ